MSLPVLVQTASRFTQSTFYGRPAVGAVPTTRNINTTSPLTGGGNLSGDLTLGLTTNPAGQIPVGVTRLINTTAPLTGGGSLAGDLTFSASTFTSGTSGIVPASGGGTTNFLCANGTWAPVAGGAGVPLTRLITTTSPLSGGGTLAGDLTLTVAQASIGTSGVVPATGGADPTKFLCATNPLTWASVPNVGAVVTLQGVTPGTADIGHAHISGTFIADGQILCGSGAFGGAGGPLGFPASQVGLALLSQGINATGNVLYMGQSVAPGGGAQSITFVRSRGTLGTPTATADTDGCGNIFWAGTNSLNGLSVSDASIGAVADGAPTTTEQPIYLDIAAGTLSSKTRLRTSQTGVVIGQSLGSSGRAASILDVQGSFGMKKSLISTNTVADATCSQFLIDGTSSAVSLTLPTAVGCTGRIYSATRIDNIGFNHDVTILTTGGQLIDGAAQAQLYYAGNFVSVISDGSNWWTISGNKPAQNRIFSNPIADTISNNTGPLGFATGFVLDTNTKYTKGGTFRIHYHGSVSCTGTPTLRLQLYFITGPTGFSDSGLYTMPSGITNATWSVEGKAVLDEAGNITGFGSIFYMPVSVSPYKTVPIVPFGGSSTFSTPSNIGLQVQWSAADPANTISCQGAYMDYYPPGHHS